MSDRDGKELSQIDGTGYAGINRVNWDLRYPMPVQPSEEDRWATSEGFFSGFVHDAGPFVEPGEYTITLHAGSRDTSTTVHVDDDPAISIKAEDRARRHEATMKAYELYKTAAAGAQTVRDLRTSLDAMLDSWKRDDARPVPKDIRTQAEALSKTVDELGLLFVGRQSGGLNVGVTYVPPPVPARLATVLHNFQSYTAAPRQQDLDKLADLTAVARCD